ncbi:MAG: carboxypeptidase regulatory-like domain-containing protein [Muribaculaceae bacterium]|nr:carboxypeptidase regulatory-like domain-containing protein [Muribaculaceae bacterium]
MKKLMFVLLMLVPQFLLAYTITGKVIDSEKEPMTGANVILYKDSLVVIGNTSADANGQFSLATDHKGSMRVAISMVGYMNSNVQFESVDQNVDLGAITLNETPEILGEITVVAQNVIENGCNYIVFPTADEIKQSGTSIDLLEQMQYKLPGLQVNSSLNRVTIENGVVIFQINGRQVDYSRIQSLNNDNILRIEYSNVSDIRYGTSVMGVVNFITKPVAKGGSVMANGMAAVGWLTNFNVGGVYNYGKSEWTIDYGNRWRDFDEVYNKGTESFIGRETPIIKEQLPEPSILKSLSNSFSVGYSYMYSPATMFAVTFRGNIDNGERITNNAVRQTLGNSVTEYSSVFIDNDKGFSPNLDLYFRHHIDKTSKIEINAYGNMRGGESNSSLEYNSISNIYSQSSSADNSSWRAGTEALYTKAYRSFETKYGVNYYHNYAENQYALNGGKFQISKQNNDNLYMYGSISGRVKNFTYSAGLGGRYYHVDNGNVEQNSFWFNSKATLNYKIDSKWSLNYLFMLDPSMPGLSSQSEIVQRIDDISYQMGNPNLKPSTYFRNRIYVRYATPKVNASLWLAHSRNLDPVYSRYTYISEASNQYYNMFMMQSQNANHDDLLNAELHLSYTGFKNFMIYGVVGWDRYTFSGFGDIEPVDNFYASIQTSYAIKNWRFTSQFDIKPRYSLSGNTLKTPEMCNVIMAQYKWKDFWFTAGIYNPFSNKGVMYKTKELSTIHPVNNEFCLKDGANMVVIGVTYRVNFGKTFKKAKQGLKNEGVDTGTESKNKLEF